MPLQIIHRDITTMDCDAIVNPTDNCFSGSGGSFYLWHYIKAGRCVSINKQVSVISGSFYVPADFDTIENAFSGVKIAEKGIK